MQVHESEEMYLETILRLSERSATVRSIDVATELGFSRPSVSKAVGLLQQRGYITVEHGGAIRLTGEGRVKAESVYERHRVITKLLTLTGAPEELAEDNACRIEHVISDDMFDYLKKYLDKC